MPSGLTRSEQWALAGVGLIIVAGVALQQVQPARSEAALDPPGSEWREVAFVRADTGSMAEMLRRQIEPQPTSAQSTSESVEPTSASLTSNISLIDLNTATQADLDTLPGIGPVRARDILIEREARKGFKAVEDLLDVRGVGEATLEKIRPLVVVNAQPTTSSLPNTMRSKADIFSAAAEKAKSASKPTAPPSTKININTANSEELQRIPGIGPMLAFKIIEFRKRKPFAKPEDMIEVSGIGTKTFEKMRDWVTVE